MGYDKVLGLIQQARAIMHDEKQSSGTRELAMALTKLDEAELWRQRDLQLKAKPIDEQASRGEGE